MSKNLNRLAALGRLARERVEEMHRANESEERRIARMLWCKYVDRLDRFGRRTNEDPEAPPEEWLNRTTDRIRSLKEERKHGRTPRG